MNDQQIKEKANLIAKSIAEHESGGKFDPAVLGDYRTSQKGKPVASSTPGSLPHSIGIGQWTNWDKNGLTPILPNSIPSTWREHARNVLGNENAPMTIQNQKAVLTGEMERRLKKYGGDVEKAIVSWNVGEGNVDNDYYKQMPAAKQYASAINNVYTRNSSQVKQVAGTQQPKQVEQSKPQPQKAGQFIQDFVDKERAKAESGNIIDKTSAFWGNVAAGAVSSAAQLGSGINTIMAKNLNNVVGSDLFDEGRYDYSVKSDKFGDKLATGVGTFVPDLAAMAAVPTIGTPAILGKLAKLSPKLAESMSAVSKSPAITDLAKTFLGRASVAGLNNAIQSTALNTAKSGGDAPEIKDVATDFAAGMVGSALVSAVGTRSAISSASKNISNIKDSSPDYESFMTKISSDDKAIRDLSKLALKDQSISTVDMNNIIKESMSIPNKADRNRFIATSIFDKSEDSMINSFEQIYNKAIEPKAGGIEMDRKIEELMRDPSIRTVMTPDGSRSIDFKNSPAVRSYLSSNVYKQDATGKIIQRDTMANIDNKLNELNDVKELAEKELDKSPEVASMFYPTEKDIVDEVMKNVDNYRNFHSDAINMLSKKSGANFEYSRDPEVIRDYLGRILTKEKYNPATGIIHPSGIGAIKKLGGTDPMANLLKDVVRKISNEKLERFTQNIASGEKIKISPDVIKGLKKTLSELGVDIGKTANNAKILQLATQAQSDLLGAKKIADLMRGQGRDVSRLMSQFLGALGADGFNPFRYHATKYAADKAQEFVSGMQGSKYGNVGKTAKDIKNTFTKGKNLKDILTKNNAK